jgi:ABC-type antimicrobial peptide transport system permease subunit
MFQGKEVNTRWMVVDYDYLKTLDLQLLAGRDFSRRFATDSTSGVIINEAMAQQLGVQDPVGVLFSVDSNTPPLQVIGVVKDFHHESLKHRIKPATLLLGSGIHYIFVKIAPDHIAESMALLKSTWQQVAPQSPFQGSFLDENTNRQYQAEERLSHLFVSAACLAILLSCMGLFAISILVMSQRTKEIGVRKVLGASVSSIIMLLAKDFLKLVLVGILFSSPVAWYLMREWLQDFAYKITISWQVFVSAGTLALLIALLTVSMQSIKAALANPVKSLRNE